MKLFFDSLVIKLAFLSLYLKRRGVKLKQMKIYLVVLGDNSERIYNCCFDVSGKFCNDYARLKYINDEA